MSSLPMRPGLPLDAAAGRTETTAVPPSLQAGGGLQPATDAVDRRQRPWRPTGSLRIATLGGFLIAIIASLHFARPILLPVVIAVLLSMLLSPAVSALEKIRLPRALGALVVIALTGTVVGSLGMHLYTPAQQWASAGPDQLGALQRKLARLRKPLDALTGATERVANMATSPAEEKPRAVVVEQRRSIAGLWSNTQAVLVSTLTTVVLLFFLLASGDLFLRKLIRVLPSLPDKIRAVEISRTVQTQIGRYFGAFTAINVGLGTVVALLAGWIGLPTPALLGTMVGVLNFVPYLGPATSLVILSLVSITTFDSVSQILLMPLAFLVITVIEGQVIQPVVLGRTVSTTAVVMFLWVLFWGWLWGVGGVAVAVPLLVATKICADHIPSWRPVAEFLGRD